MDKSSEFAIKSIRALELSPDGQYLLIHGDQPTAALHRSVLNNLLIALPNAIECAERVIQKNADVGFALHCQGWEIGKIGGTPDIVIRFWLGGEAGISFMVPRGQIPHLQHALAAIANLETAPDSSGCTLQ
jgi:hypothetical protein